MFLQMRDQPVSHVKSRLHGQALEQIQEQLVVVLLVGHVLAEGSRHLLLDTKLLGGDEGLQHHSDGHVDIILNTNKNEGENASRLESPVEDE